MGRTRHPSYRTGFPDRTNWFRRPSDSRTDPFRCIAADCAARPPASRRPDGTNSAAPGSMGAAGAMASPEAAEARGLDPQAAAGVLVRRAPAVRPPDPARCRGLWPSARRPVRRVPACCRANTAWDFPVFAPARASAPRDPGPTTPRDWAASTRADQRVAEPARTAPARAWRAPARAPAPGRGPCWDRTETGVERAEERPRPPGGG